MRTIGMDLAITSAHKAVVVNEQNRFVTPILRCATQADELQALFARAREGAAADEPLQVVMEPTGMAWFPVAVYCRRQGVAVVLPNSQEVADLRRYYRRHAKSDRIDARVLGHLPWVNPEATHVLQLPSAATLACQRACKELNRLTEQIAAIKNRLRALDRFAWPGPGQEVPLWAAPYEPAARWVREHYYDPQQVLHVGAAQIRAEWQHSSQNAGDDGAWSEWLVVAAREVLALYGTSGTYLDFARLQAEVTREQAHLAYLEPVHHTVLEHMRALYREIHPSRNLETLRGVGEEGAAVYASFIGVVARFHSACSVRGWSGMVPNSKQSSSSEAKGLHLTQAGPNLVRKFAFLNANIARQFDPQIAALYYRQVVEYSKHHTQAVCACASHLLDRVYRVLADDRPYELRDVDGTPVTAAEAQAIIAERYMVPTEVRRRNNKRARQARRDRRAEQQTRRAEGATRQATRESRAR